MYNRKYSNLKQIIHKKSIKNILGKVIEKKKLIPIFKKKKIIYKVIITDLFACIEIFSTNFRNIRIGDIIKISKSKPFYYRNCFKIISFFCESIKLSPFNDRFTTTLQKNYSKKKYKIFN